MNNYTDNSISEKHVITNLRQYSRNIPSHSLQPYVDVRPLNTKYVLFPTFDNRQTDNIQMAQSGYKQENVFNPGDSAPWCGYDVSKESDLRNQLYARQNNPQSVYIPSSSSDLYINNINVKPEHQPFPNLFKEYVSSSKDVEPPMTSLIFNNSSRTEVKNMTRIKKTF